MSNPRPTRRSDSAVAVARVGMTLAAPAGAAGDLSPGLTKTWPVLALLAAMALVPAASWAAEDMHVTEIPKSGWSNLPEWIPMDVQLDDCGAKGGAPTGDPRHRLCSIRTADCEGHSGYKVVERDTYRTGSARIAACRRM